jgi:hypothetical protein
VLDMIGGAARGHRHRLLKRKEMAARRAAREAARRERQAKRERENDPRTINLRRGRRRSLLFDPDNDVDPTAAPGRQEDGDWQDAEMQGGGEEDEAGEKVEHDEGEGGRAKGSEGPDASATQGDERRGSAMRAVFADLDALVAASTERAAPLERGWQRFVPYLPP